MLLERRVFRRPPWPGQGQGARQEPEGDGGQQGDDPGDEVAQPPGPHPAGVCRGDGDALCGSSGRLISPQFTSVNFIFNLKFSQHICKLYTSDKVF